MEKYIIVFLGGGIGSVLRFSISLLVAKWQSSLPIATFLSNVISCSIFGLLMYLYQNKDFIPETYKLLVIIGICGGLSTFSTFSYETYELIKQDQVLIAIINVLFNTLFCLGIFSLFISK